MPQTRVPAQIRRDVLESRIPRCQKHLIGFLRTLRLALVIRKLLGGIY
jgi:hypothetical protein